mmetsp:Transcript_12921/g.28792  ORF Transcript_12921/g.28792 Transcript_12921/m.28792 type:complete len:310 (+) Transcript_12921:1488-2417(+)
MHTLQRHRRVADGLQDILTNFARPQGVLISGGFRAEVLELIVRQLHRFAAYKAPVVAFQVVDRGIGALLVRRGAAVANRQEPLLTGTDFAARTGPRSSPMLVLSRGLPGPGFRGTAVATGAAAALLQGHERVLAARPCAFHCCESLLRLTDQAQALPRLRHLIDPILEVATHPSKGEAADHKGGRGCESGRRCRASGSSRRAGARNSTPCGRRRGGVGGRASGRRACGCRGGRGGGGRDPSATVEPPHETGAAVRRLRRRFVVACVVTAGLKGATLKEPIQARSVAARRCLVAEQHADLLTDNTGTRSF